MDTLGYVWDSLLYGFSLIQCGDIVDGKPTEITLVPRQMVKPELGIVAPMASATMGVDYRENEWAWGCGSPTDLGLMAKLAVLVIYKQHAMSAWAQMVELFGMPIRIGKVNMADEKRAESMFLMLQNMNSAGYGVMDTDDTVEFVETAKGGGQNAHQVFIQYLDEQISKLIFGQTMMADNGSSRSQSEVHERLGNDYTLYDLKLLERQVNDVIIPKMITIGFTELANCRFQFAKAEDVAALYTMVIQAMSQKVPVDLDWFSETFGIKLKEVQTPSIQDNGTTSVGAEDAQSSPAGEAGTKQGE